MPPGRPPKITPALKQKIANCFLVALTDVQTAQLCGINEKTIRRMRAGGFCPEIKKAEMERELKYRMKLWTSKTLPAGICFMLERKYPNQFAKPEVQMNLNLQHNETHQTLIIAAEAAKEISGRVRPAEAKFDELLKLKNVTPNGNGANGGNSHT